MQLLGQEFQTTNQIVDNVSIHGPSGGQMCDQKVAVQHIFCLERSSFLYLLALMARTLCSVSLPVLATPNVDPDSCPPENEATPHENHL